MHRSRYYFSRRAFSFLKSQFMGQSGSVSSRTAVGAKEEERRLMSSSHSSVSIQSQTSSSGSQRSNSRSYFQVLNCDIFIQSILLNLLQSPKSVEEAYFVCYLHNTKGGFLAGLIGLVQYWEMAVGKAKHKTKKLDRLPNHLKQQISPIFKPFQFFRLTYDSNWPTQQKSSPFRLFHNIKSRLQLLVEIEQYVNSPHKYEVLVLIDIEQNLSISYYNDMQNTYLSQSQKRSSTPSQRQKYNNYTPRKRYMKEQQQFSQYMHQQKLQLQNPTQFEPQPERNYRVQLSSSLSKNQEKSEIQPPLSGYKKQTEFGYEFGEILNDCTASLSNGSSLRKRKYNRCLDEKQLGIKLDFETENTIFGNKNKIRNNRQKLIQVEPLTLRKTYRKDDQKDTILTEKMAILRQKIDHLQKMQPIRSNTPSKSRIVQHTKLEYELQNQQKQTLSSRVVSQRQNELMSRVSLGRLAQQQQPESQIDVIQDLSYKINSKLQAIIRNYG